jgi:hypothetical protein
VSGLSSKHGPKDFSVTAELVLCVPNSAESSKLLNRHQFRDRIVLVNRGVVSVQQKVTSISSGGSGVLAIIIIDDGTCDEEFAHCGVRMGSVSEGGFAAFDDKSFWDRLDVPVLLVSEKSGDKLKSLMRNEWVDIPRVGRHLVTSLDESEEL